MSEPQKKPEKVEPSAGERPEIKKDEPASMTGDITPPAPAANNNEARDEKPPVKKPEPLVGVTEGVKPGPVAVPATEETAKPAEGKAEPAEGDAAPAETGEAKPEEKKPDTPVAGETVLPPVPAASDNAVSGTPPGDKPPVPPADTPATTDSAAPEKKSRMKGFLKGAFNFVASAGVSAAASLAAKGAVGVALGVAGAPVLATIAVSGLAVGASVTIARDAFEHYKSGKTLKEYFSKAHAKEFFHSKKNRNTFLISTAGALVGSAVAMLWHEGVIQGAWDRFWNGPAPVQPPVETVIAPPVVVEEVIPPVVVEEVIPPVETVVPVVACLTPSEHFANLIDGQEVSSRVTDAMNRAASTNARVSAQGLKDLAYFAFNGFDGVPQSNTVAVELFKQAAEAGNVQAKVDLVYMQYHGLGGITADPQAATATMHTLPGARAAMFTSAWGGVKGAAGAVFSTDSILKGMTVGCPAPA